MSWRQDTTSTVVCTGLNLTLLPDQPAQPVTATLVRSLPVAGLINAARAERFAAAGGEVAAAVDAGQDLDVTRGLVDSLRAQAEPWAERTPGRPVELGAKHYGAVAAVYSAALAGRNAPLLAVQRTWTVSRPTASRWVRAARDAGLLPPTDRGRARGFDPITGITNTRGTAR
jgi:hypothetical protein